MRAQQYKGIMETKRSPPLLSDSAGMEIFLMLIAVFKIFVHLCKPLIQLHLYCVIIYKLMEQNTYWYKTHLPLLKSKMKRPQNPIYNLKILYKKSTKILYIKI